MPKKTLQFKAVVSSPSDMEADRDAVEEAIAEINADDLGITIDLKRWDRDVFPDKGKDPQAVINRQIIEDSDILIALIGSRLGTPTPRAASGTVEEILIAIERERPANVQHSIQVYFKRVKVSVLAADPKEIERIQNFRDDLSRRGVFFFEYEELAELQRMVRQATRRCATSWEPHAQSPFGAASPSSDETSSSEVMSSREEDMSDEGILDYMETFETEIADAAARIGQVGGTLNELAPFINSKADEMAGMAQAKTGEKKTLINKVAARMSRDAKGIRHNLELANEKTNLAFSALSAALSLHSPDMLRPSDIATFNTVIETLISQARSSLESNASFAAAISQLPRMTKDLNLAKREMFEAMDLFRTLATDSIQRASDLRDQARMRLEG